MNQKISRLDVSMDDILLMNLLEACGYLLEDVDALVLAEFSSLRLDIVLEVLLTILKEEV